MRLMNNKNSNEDFLNKIIYLMQTDKSEDAPQDSVKWAKNVFRVRAAEPKQSFAQKVLAVLQIDFSKNQPAFGERFSGSKTSKQIFVEAGKYAVDLRIEKSGKSWNLRGQIFGDIPPKSILRFEGHDSVFETEIDEFSEFSCQTDSLENYALRIIQPE